MKQMNIDTFYIFEHKYLLVKQLRFKENTFIRVLTKLKIKCNKNSHSLN